MKKQIDSVNNWTAKSIITVIIMSAMLCGIGAKASNEPTVVSNVVKVEMNSENSFESRVIGYAETVDKYNALEFVQSDIALEIDNWMYNNTENNNNANEKYNAAEFVQAEMTYEINNWMKNNSL